MGQFRLAKKPSAEETGFVLDGPEAFHAAKVLRYGPGDAISLFDGSGQKFTGVIERIEATGEIFGRIVSRSAAEERAISVHLYQALPKSKAWEDILQKGTQIGIDRFIPVLSSRGVVIIDEKKRSERRARWEKIVLAALKQSHRPIAAVVENPMGFPDAVKDSSGRGLTPDFRIGTPTHQRSGNRVWVLSPRIRL